MRLPLASTRRFKEQAPAEHSSAATMSFVPGGFDDSDDEFDVDGFSLGDSAPSQPTQCVGTTTKPVHDVPKGGFGLPPGYMNGTTKGDQQNTFSPKGPGWSGGKAKQQGPKIIKHTEQPIPVDDFRNAVLWGKTEQIQTYIDQGVAVDTVLRAGWTALMYAGKRANPAAVKILLDNNADPNYHNDRHTVLMATCSSEHSDENMVLQCLEALVEKGAHINDFDRYHMSALMYAARDGRALVTRRLIELGANIGKQDTKGFSALTWATYRGRLRVVQVLLEAGADVTQQTCDGSKPLDIAQTQGHDLIIKILKSHSSGQLDSKSLSTIVNVAEEEQKTEKSPNNCVQYGDLEMFLTGLELGNLIPVFQENNISFQAFLRSTDADLQQIGINKLGVRKKILDAIRDTHTKSWETSSLASIQYSKQISCPESVAMLSNIGKHSSYISSTVGFITDQIKAHPDILRTGQEGASIDEMSVRTEEAMTNVRILYGELSQLAIHLAQMSSKENFQPPDLIIKPRQRQKKKQQRRLVVSVVIGCSVLGACVWQRKSVIELCQSLFSKGQ